MKRWALCASSRTRKKRNSHRKITGEALINFPEIPPTISVIVFTIWIIFFLWGRAQFNNVKDKTVSLIIENIDEAKKKIKNLTIDQYYEMIYPQFEEIVKTSAKFIPHKTELFPVPAKPEYVKTRMNFTPEWVGAILSLHGHAIKADRKQQKTIEYIIALSKIKSRKQF